MADKKRQAEDFGEFKKHFAMPDPTDGLRGRILADARRVLKPRLGDILWPFGPVWKPAGFLAGAMALGIAMGVYVMPTDNADISNEIDTIILG